MTDQNDRSQDANHGEPIGIGSVVGAGAFPNQELTINEAADRTYAVKAFPQEHAESDGEYGVGLTERIHFEGGQIERFHDFSPQQARELAARLTAAADKLGHVPDEDAIQPAEL